jgi:hypothetical protein
MEDNEEGWGKDPKDILMLEYHDTGDDEYNRHCHCDANETWIKDLFQD